MFFVVHPSVTTSSTAHRVSKYQEYGHQLNMSGIQYPVDIKDTGKFEH